MDSLSKKTCIALKVFSSIGADNLTRTFVRLHELEKCICLRFLQLSKMTPNPLAVMLGQAYIVQLFSLGMQVKLPRKLSSERTVQFSRETRNRLVHCFRDQVGCSVHEVYCADFSVLQLARSIRWCVSESEKVQLLKRISVACVEKISAHSASISALLSKLITSESICLAQRHFNSLVFFSFV